MNEKLLELLGVLFASKLKNPDKETIKAWVKLLSVLPYEKVKEAIEKLIYTKDDFVSIGLIFEMINPVIDNKAQAIEQWEQVREFCRGHANNMDDTAIDTVRKISTFEHIGNITNEYERDQIKRDFISVYIADSKLQNNKLHYKMEQIEHGKTKM